MGLLRLVLALSVLMTHAFINQSNFLFTSKGAVISFFIISGFYMALILDKKYSSIKNFYKSRFLRIYPIYLISLLTILSFGMLKTFLNIGSSDNAILHYFNYASEHRGISSFIEFVNFLLRNLTLIINKDYFFQSSNLAPGYLIVNQAWSLQVELIFYLLAPFIISLRNKFIYLVAIYASALVFIMIPNKLTAETSLTFLFLNYLIYFLLGIISYRYIYKIIEHKNLTHTERLIFFITMLFIAIYYFLPFKIADYHFPSNLIFFIPFLISVPFIFRYTKNNKYDRFLGELSYPVFITHMIFAKILFSYSTSLPSFLNFIIILIPTIIFSLVLIKFVQNPIDNFRHKRLKQS